MKLYEFLTGFLMFAIIFGIVVLSQPAQAGGNRHNNDHQCSQDCGGGNPPPPVIPTPIAIEAEDNGNALKRFWAKHRKPVSWLGAIGLGVKYAPKFRNDVSAGRRQTTVTVIPPRIGAE